MKVKNNLGYKMTVRKAKRKTKKSYHHGDLKAALMRTAVSHMRKTGSLDFSLRDICAEAGTTHTSIYRHFPSKTFLLGAIAEDGFTRFKAALDEATQKHQGNWQKQMTEQGIAYLQFALTNPTHYRVMFSEEIRECMKLPSLAEAAEAAFMSLIKLVVAGVESKVLPTGDPRNIALTIWSSTHGLATLMLNGLLKNAFEVGDKQAVHAATVVSKTLQYGILPREQ